MFLRLHLVFRLLRDYSDVWGYRRQITKDVSLYISTAPEFDWALALKTICFRQPLMFACTSVLVLNAVFGYAVYILEREAQPDLFDIWGSMFVATQVLLTGWATDTYDQLNPVTLAGKYTCIFATVAGLFLIAYMIGVASQQLAPSAFEINSINWVLHRRITDAEREAAARLIQFVFRNHLKEQKLERELAHSDPALYDVVSDREEKAVSRVVLIYNVVWYVIDR